MNLKAKDTSGSLLLGLIFPIIGAIKALLNPKSDSFVLLFTLFYSFLGIGYCFSFQDGSDVSRYAMNFLEICNKDISFIEYFNSLHQSNQIDYFLPFMTWLGSRITGNYHVFLGLLALINGFFIGCNVSYVARKAIINKETTWLIVLLALVSNPTFVTHRWWVALNVFLFGTIRYLVDGGKKYLVVSAAALLIHFSFIYPLLFLFVISFLPSGINVFLLIIFCITTFMDTFNLAGVSDFVASFLPDSYVSRTDMYINFEHQEHNFLSRSVQYFFKFLNVILSIAIYVVTKNSKDYPYINFFNVCLIMGIFSALAGSTEAGWRYYDITYFLFTSLYILTISHLGGCEKWKIIKFAIPFFIYIIIYQIRSILSGIGPLSLFFGNYFTIWFIDDDFSVLQLIKRIL